MRWRFDKFCGQRNPLKNGTPAECNPAGKTPCCGIFDRCGTGRNFCDCKNCINYALVQQIKKSGKTCAVVSKWGFLKQVCFDQKQRRTSYKCPSSDLEYETLDPKVRDPETSKIIIGGFHVSKLCPNDQRSYQACGLFDGKIAIENQNHGILCGGYFKNMCGDSYAMNFEDTVYKYMDCDVNCSDNGDCLAPLESQEKGATLCNDRCDDPNIFCKDESNCNGYRYGANCHMIIGKTSMAVYAPIHMICTDYTSQSLDHDCSPEIDENDCLITNNTSHTCYHYLSKVRDDDWVKVPLLNYTRCSIVDLKNNGFPYCWKYLDQTNCTDVKRVGGRCFVNGYMTSVSKYIVCDSESYEPNMEWEARLCDNDLEHACVLPTSYSQCRIHKHKLCNGKFECVNKEDENNDYCSFLTKNFVCERSFFLNSLLPIPLSWIMDGVSDCINGEDEDITQWSFCGKEENFRRVKQPEEECQDVFICPGNKTSYVRFDNLCDGLESCETENKVCWIARDFPAIHTMAPSNNSMIDLCKDLQIPVNKSCALETVDKWSINVFGAGTSISLKFFLPNFEVTCRDKFGEYFVYFSCLGMCSESNSKCPLNDKPLLHDSCPGQFPDRLYTLADNSYLTFVRESNNEYHYTNYYQCENSKCVEYNKLCNLVDDCGDGSDEANCSNHVVCQETAEKSKKHFISVEQKCDGRYDCFDFSDECNGHCGREIFRSLMLKGMCWTVGILAVVFNLIAVFRVLSSLKDCDSEAMLINQALVTVIATGDLLTGVYLTVLSVYDSFVYGEKFCEFQATWLTSTTCSVLGVISTLGSQLSLFAMTVLSFIRACGLIGRQFQRSSSVGPKTVAKVVVIVTGIVLICLAIALTPLIPQLEDYFVQGMYYDPSYKVFIGFPDKGRHLQILQTYFGNNMTNQNIAINESMSWRKIGGKIDEMFSADYGRLERTPVHFYGNDGVCLFKYFIRSDDARRSRNTLEGVSDITDHKGNLIVWIMLGLNFTCVIGISICYSLIMIFVRKSSTEIGSAQSRQKEREMRIMQNRIGFMIVTDFLSWVPFIFASALHNIKIIDATEWYIIFAVLLLPMNSFINPLIYDNQLREGILFIVQKIIFRRKKRIGGVEGDTVAVEEIELQTMNNATLSR